MVPGAGWADVARRSDIDALRTEIGALRSEFDGKLGRLEGRIYAAMAAQTIAILGIVISLTKLT
jgi:hypothetical protein